MENYGIGERDIFFRYWDTDINKILVLPEGILPATISGLYPVMQYTGLKDKNGVEIFEGDIITSGDINIKYTVEWHNCGLMARQNGNKSYIGLDYWIGKIEVIGNVFENEDLLTNLQDE